MKWKSCEVDSDSYIASVNGVARLSDWTGAWCRYQRKQHGCANPIHVDFFSIKEFWFLKKNMLFMCYFVAKFEII